MVRRILRIFAGIVLILLAIPPMTLGVINWFVLEPAFIGIIVIFLPLPLAVLKRICGRHYHAVIRAFSAALAAICVVFMAEFTVIYANSFAQKAPDNAVVVVPGARAIGSTPTILLLGRINAAGAFLKSHPDSVCIATGARGADETESEAMCISDWLQKYDGIPASRIFIDDQSRSTAQNFDNAKKIIEENHLPHQVAVATDGFHILRCKMIASRRGLTPYACPANTNIRFQLECYLRELLAFPKSWLTD